MCSNSTSEAIADFHVLLASKEKISWRSPPARQIRKFRFPIHVPVTEPSHTSSPTPASPQQSHPAALRVALGPRDVSGLAWAPVPASFFRIIRNAIKFLADGKLSYYPSKFPGRLLVAPHTRLDVFSAALAQEAHRTTAGLMGGAKPDLYIWMFLFVL